MREIGGSMEFFDSHSHYNDEKFDQDREAIIEETYQAGITKWICAGYNISSSQKAVELATNYPFIYAIAGISPNDITQKEKIEKEIEKIEEIAKHPKVVAIGEIGLDYYWNKDNKDLQKEYFRKQIELANKMDLPIVIHSRDASIDTIAMLKENPPKKKGVFHCVQLNQELIKQAINLEFYLSFAGPITFKNAKNVSEILKLVPLEKILIETDSPYLTPEPNRGKRNDSRNVIYVAKKIAEVKQKSLEEIATSTYQNAKKIFAIK